MRQYLVLTLVVAMAGVILVAGCSTNSSAVKRTAYVDEHPELPELMADAIVNGQIMVGMSEEMVEVAWGKPSRVADVVDETEVTEEWVYGNYFTGGNITNLFFDETGTLLRYEVNANSSLATTGSVEAGGATATTGTGSGTASTTSKGGAGSGP